MPASMPRLSEDLTGPDCPDRCRACGGFADLARWREHDEADRPEPILVTLCDPCAERIIEPHPRLYERLHRNAPWPGAMTICLDCAHRRGVRCAHPDAKANGGPGVALTIPAPARGFLDFRDNRGRRRGTPFIDWPGPATECRQKAREDRDTIPIGEYLDGPAEAERFALDPGPLGRGR